MATPAAILHILVRANTGQAMAALKAVDGKTKQSAATAQKATATMERVGTGAKIGATAAAVGLGYAVKKAADFEEQLSSLESVTEANSRQMGRLRKQAMEAGAATKFSALDAAQAQTELAKGGLEVSQIMRGGLRSSLALAAAGEMNLADAAGTTANAIKLFGLRGKDSMKVADALATAANKTTADVSDFALALKMGGSVAKLAGLSFNDTVVTLEALAEAGIKGSDAGTSMKAFFLNLTRDAPKAKKAMKELGVEIFDSQGNLKSLPAISANLRKSFGDLTKEQFLNKAGTIAGSDAIRTLYSLYDAGPIKLRKLAEATSRQGSALDVAAKKQDNFKGKLENLQGSLETIAIGFGTKLLPELTSTAEKITDILGDPKLASEEKLQKASKVFADLVGKGLDAGVDAAGEAGPQIVGALATSFVQSWRDMNPFAKLLTAAAIIRVVGGRGALTATGAMLGRSLGAGVAAGAAAGAVGGGAAAGGGLIGRMRGGLLPLAKRAGLVGVGLALADGVISEFGRRAQEKSPDLIESIRAQSEGGKILGFDTANLPGGESVHLKEHEATARKILPLLDQIAGKRGMLAQADINEIAASAHKLNLTKEQGKQLSRTIDLLNVGKSLGIKVDLGMDPKKLQQLDMQLQKLRAGTYTSMGDIAKVSQRNMAIVGQALGKGTAEGRIAARKNLLATAQAFSLYYATKGPEAVKRGNARITALIRRADLISPTRAKAKQFGHEWAKGLDTSKEATRRGVREMIREAQKMPAPMRKVALQTWNSQITAAVKAKRISKTEAQDMRATARAIQLQMIRSGDVTKNGMARVARLIRQADLLSPTRAKAQQFGREWAKGLDTSKEATRKGVREMIREAQKMPAPMRKVALQTWNNQITAAQKAGKITKSEAQNMRSKVTASFQGIELNSRTKSKRTADAVIRNNQRMTTVSSNAFGVLVENANSALGAFGVVKKLEYKARKVGEQKKQQGGFIVPGSGSGDTFQTSVPAGSFVLNREATKAFGFQKGGMAPVALEPGERVFMPDEVQRVGHKALHAANKAVPRFQTGGIVGIPWAPGEEVAASILPLLTKLHNKFGFTVTDAFDRDRSAGHKSPGHNLTGTAVDAAGGDLAGLVRWAVSKGLTTYWNGGSGATPLAGHDTHAHIEFGGAGALGAAMEKLARFTLDGPAGPLRDMGQGAIDKVRQAGDRMLAKNAMVSGSSDLFAPFGGLQGLGGNAAANRALGEQMAARVGWVGPQWAALDHLWGVDESGWNEGVANYAGSGAYGIAQALPASKYPPAGRPDAPNGPPKAKAQIAWGLQYIRDRYGDPLAADAFRHANNWYQKGGLVQALAKGGPIGMVGDSLGEGTEGPLRGLLTGRALKANNAKNRTSAQGVGLFGGLGKVAQYVFDLGTNDGSAGALRSSLRSVSKLAGDKPIHALTVRSPYEAGPKNEMLRQLAGRGKDGVGNLHLIPWANIAGNYTGGDPQGIHPNGAGYSKRAHMIHDSIQKAAETADKAKGKGKNKPDGTPFERSVDKAMGIARKTPTVKNRRKTRKAMRRALKIIQGLGIDAKQKELKKLTDQADKYGEYATNAQGLTVDGDDGNSILGKFQGQDEGHWLNQQLETLMSLRAKLLNAEKLVSEEKPKAEKLLNAAKQRLRKVQAALEAGRRRKAKLEGDLRKLEKQLDQLQKKPKVNKAAIDTAKTKIKDVKGDLGQIDKAQKQRGRVRDLLGGDKGVVGRIEKKRSSLNTLHGNLLGDGGDRGWKGLAAVQGMDGPMEKMKKPPVIGVLGGEILTAQKALDDFGRKPDVSADTADSGPDSERTGLLEQLLREANQRSAVANAQFATLRNFHLGDGGMPFAGMFAKGGQIPAGMWGIAGERGPEPIMGPATVVSNRDAQSMLAANQTGGGSPNVAVYVHENGGGADVFIDDKQIDASVTRMGRKAANKANRAASGWGQV